MNSNSFFKSILALCCLAGIILGIVAIACKEKPVAYLGKQYGEYRIYEYQYRGHYYLHIPNSGFLHAPSCTCYGTNYLYYPFSPK